MQFKCHHRRFNLGHQLKKDQFHLYFQLLYKAKLIFQRHLRKSVSIRQLFLEQLLQHQHLLAIMVKQTKQLPPPHMLNNNKCIGINNNNLNIGHKCSGQLCKPNKKLEKQAPRQPPAPFLLFLVLRHRQKVL